MARLIKAICVLSTGSWFSFLAVQQLAAQQSVDAQQSVELSGDGPVRITDIGLGKQLPSAIDLVGPESGSAGRNRAALVLRLRCWIDGQEKCSAADRNDPRVRAIRRFLAFGPADRHGALTVQFPDQSRIRVRLVRVSDLNPNDWDTPVYEPVVLANTARAPGLPSVPAHVDHFADLSYEGAPEILAALERLKKRLEATSEPAPLHSSDRRALVQERLPYFP